MFLQYTPNLYNLDDLRQALKQSPTDFLMQIHRGVRLFLTECQEAPPVVPQPIFLEHVNSANDILNWLLTQKVYTNPINSQDQ